MGVAWAKMYALLLTRCYPGTVTVRGTCWGQRQRRSELPECGACLAMAFMRTTAWALLLTGGRKISQWLPWRGPSSHLGEFSVCPEDKWQGSDWLLSGCDHATCQLRIGAGWDRGG